MSLLTIIFTLQESLLSLAVSRNNHIHLARKTLIVLFQRLEEMPK